MGVQIYTISFEQELPAEVYRTLIAALPLSLADKVGRFRHWKDAHASLLGKWLAIHALAEAGCQVSLEDLQQSAYGRPFFTGAPDFNISHSGTRVVCAVTPVGSIGIDIEEIRPMEIDDLRGQFTALEWAAIEAAPDRLRQFYHYWTAKECLIKADGRGLSLPLAQLHIGESETIRVDGREWRLRTLPDFHDHACNFCVDYPIKNLNINELDARILLSSVRRL